MLVNPDLNADQSGRQFMSFGVLAPLHFNAASIL
jgi:hypothetical protein